MKISIKYILLFLIAIVMLVVIFLYAGDTDRQEMIAKYGGGEALFIDDGYGGQIHYRNQGNKDGPALLLIHGSNSHLQTWSGVVDALQDKYHIISYDQPGHGLSGPAGNDDYSGDAMASAGVKVLDAAGVKEAIWIGNSMGGWVSWRAALAYPERLSALVLIDASGAQGGERIEPYLGAKLMQTSFGQAILPYVTPKFIVKSSLRQSIYDPETLSEDVITRYWELLRFPGNRQATIKRSLASRENEKWNDIDQIDSPVLILWGEEDRVIPVSHADLFAAKIDQTEKIIYPKIGHLPMEEDAQRVADDIDKFIVTRIPALFSNKNSEKK